MVSFGGQMKSCTTDDRGRWQTRLDAMPASAEPRSLSVAGTDSPAIKVENLLVGEVWIASGQSNMQWGVASTRKEDQESAGHLHQPPSKTGWLRREFRLPRGT